MRTQLMHALRSYLARKNRTLVSTMTNLGRDRHIDVLQNEYTNEYVRLSHVDLAIDEIHTRNVPGHVAEVGVYKGHMAAVLNRAFPDRQLYLFDTFSGFDRAQETADRFGYGLTHRRDFADTSVDIVLARMPYRSKCVVRMGLFPETAIGLEAERFAFVSLDPDLYQPIYDGLNFFYDRLSPGGFIFVHDYNNNAFPGAKQAVRDFSSEKTVPFVPISDVYGTAIFTR